MAVFIVADRDMAIPLCSPCIEAMRDPAATRAAIIARADDAHCVECDFHPTCRPSCPAHVSLAAVSRLAWLVAAWWPINPDEVTR